MSEDAVVYLPKEMVSAVMDLFEGEDADMTPDEFVQACVADGIKHEERKRKAESRRVKRLRRDLRASHERELALSRDAAIERDAGRQRAHAMSAMKARIRWIARDAYGEAHKIWANNRHEDVGPLIAAMVGALEQPEELRP